VFDRFDLSVIYAGSFARIDRTEKGAILVDQRPMIELQHKLWPVRGER